MSVAEAATGTLLAVAFFTNAYATEPDQRRMPWERLAAGLTEHKRREGKDGKLWSPTEYQAGTTRAARNVVSLSALVLDFDTGTTPEILARHWERWEYVIYSTHSSTPETPKWRAVFPLREAVPAGAWAGCHRKLALALGFGLTDPCCKDASRMYYLPSCPPAAAPFVTLHAGEWLDPDLFPEPPPPPLPVREPTDWQEGEMVPPRVLLSRALDNASGGRNNAGLWLACQLRDNGYTEGAAEGVMCDYASRVPQTGSPYPEKEALDTLKKAYARAARTPWARREDRAEILARNERPLMPKAPEAEAPAVELQSEAEPDPVETSEAAESEPDLDTWEELPAGEAVGETVLPHSLPAEKRLLGGVLAGCPEVTLREALEIVSPPDYYFRAHDYIWDAVRDLAETGKPVDADWVEEKLRETGCLGTVGGRKYLDSLVAERPRDLATLPSVAELVRKKRRLRDRIQLLRETEAACLRADADPERIDEDLTRCLLAGRGNGKEEAVWYVDALREEYARLERGEEEKSLLFGVSCVDRLTDGLAEGDVGIICGRPSTGKSVFCAQQLHYGAQHWGVGLYVSLEMSAAQDVRRDLAGLTGFRYRELRKAGRVDEEGRRRPFTPSELAEIREAMARLSESGRRILIDPQTSRLSKLIARVHRYRLQHDLKFLLVDYGQLVRDDVSKRAVGKAEEVMNVARALKTEVAQPAKIPVWVAVQANRESEKGEKRPLGFRDLGWSGEWEAVASLILFLNSHPDRSKFDGNGQRHILLDCQKNRNDGKGGVSLILDAPRFRFGEDMHADPWDDRNPGRWGGRGDDDD